MASPPAGKPANPTKQPAPGHTAAGFVAPVKKRTDWEAVERDYRITSLTLRELGAKHGCGHSAIANKVTRKGWTRDLSGAVRAATNAMLIESSVTSGVTKAVQDVTSAVLVTADANTRIILGHRSRLVDLAGAVDAAQAKLLELGDSVADIREAATFVQAVGHLATATKTLIEQERKAFQLDDAPPENKDSMADFLREIAGGNSAAFVPVHDDPAHA